MNLQHIKYAQAVMRHGSINKAAKDLYITQPYLSYCIKELENSLGIKLFNRTSMGSLITDEGKEFLEMAQPLLIKAESIKEKYSKKIQTNKFVICSTRTQVALKAFEIFCQEMMRKKHYQLSFFETGIVEVIDQVYYNIADIGIVVYLTGEEDFVKKYVKDKNLEIINIDSVPVYVTVSINHELANYDLLSGHQMESYPCVTYSDFMDSVLNLEKECELIGVEKPARLIYVRDRHTLLKTLSTTEAYAVAHKFFDDDNEPFNLVSIPVKDATSQICFGYVTRNSDSDDKDYDKLKYQEVLVKSLKDTVTRCFK
ncbi:MAG: LysR family transcriptional regulator [Dethiobacteria bacterium]